MPIIPLIVEIVQIPFGLYLCLAAALNPGGDQFTDDILDLAF